MKAEELVLIACFAWFGWTVGGLTGTVIAQNPPGPNTKTPVQIDVETQNEVLKLQMDMKDMQSEYMECSSRMQNISGGFNEDQKKIKALEDAALKKLGLDPETHEVNGKTFYVSEKPPQPKPEAKKEPEKR